MTVYSALFFFFSSRRRHTRCLSDWSSDVCSSDLPASVPETDTAIRLRAAGGSLRRAPGPWYSLDPAWLSTSTERAASLDSAYPQPDGERIVTWFPSTD